jgi:hypothetical protein
MLEYDDFFIVTDTKYLDMQSNRRTFDIIRNTVNAIDPTLINRIAIQFYNRDMYHFLTQNYDFPHENYMYTLYKSHDSNNQVIEFVRREDIRAVVMWHFRVSERFVAALNDTGAVVYAHTINDAQHINDLLASGVYGALTDTVTYCDMRYSRMGRYAILFQNLSGWAEAEVGHALANGLVPRSLQASFDQAATRAEFCALAVTLYEKVRGEITGRVTFIDTNDVNVQKAAYIGVVTGVGDNRFNPNANVTREQAAVIIMNTCRAIGADVSNPPPSGFADMGSASSWAVDGINFVRANGIMQGTGNDNFSPSANYTREQSIITFNNINHNELPGR